MLNPLSIKPGQKISGKEINDWCHNQIDNNLSHKKEAYRLLKKKYNDNAMYALIYKSETGCDTDRHTILFKK